MTSSTSPILSKEAAKPEYVQGVRVGAVLLTLLLINTISQIDRILPFILAESIKTDLNLTDTQIGLVTGLAFAVCYTLLSLPLARAADRGSPKLVLLGCLLIWSAMTVMGGFAAGFLYLTITRLGVAVGEAGAIPSGHALIARVIRPERRGLAIGLFSMGIPLGTMVGFGAGGALADTLGWRLALIGAGAAGGLVFVLTLLVLPSTPPQRRAAMAGEPFVASALKLLSAPAFHWLFVSALAIGFATTPFYAFSAPFLIRTHGLSASEVGLSFGLLQGAMGVIGTFLGGRGFDRAVRLGRNVVGGPAVLFLVSAATTTVGLFAPAGWMSVLLFVPAMFSFAFLLPCAFGAAHLVAGSGKQAMASSLVMVGSSLVGPALGPLIVGVVSDAATSAQLPNSLGLGLIIVPIASVLTGVAALIANKRINQLLANERLYVTAETPGAIVAHERPLA